MLAESDQLEMKIDNATISRHLKGYWKRKDTLYEKNPENNREVFVLLSEKATKELAQCERSSNSNNSLCLSLYLRKN